MISKPIIINEYSNNNKKNNNNQIVNIKMESLKGFQIFNTDLLNKKIRIKLKSKEIGNKNIKFTIFRIFRNMKHKYKTIKPVILHKNTGKLKYYKYKIKNWYNIINIADINSEIINYKIMIKGRISSKKGASRTKSYIYETNTKRLKNLTDYNVNSLILKNGSTGINIKIDSFLAIKFNINPL